MIPALLAAAAMTLKSPDFTAGGVIPAALMSADCGGQNRTPDLEWTNPPSATKSFALIERDPDAPIADGFYHWVVYDAPATARSSSSLGKSQTGRSSTGKTAYYGPCPPPGPAHHYIFTLYALDVGQVGGKGPFTGPQLEARLRGHVLERATLQATAAHP
jgi:Raf kinase inhibitor-like YbhB/YbcL family protein